MAQRRVSYKDFINALSALCITAHFLNISIRPAIFPDELADAPKKRKPRE
jgi:hypothetical protein